MFNIAEELKVIQKSNNILTKAEITKAFNRGVVFSDIHVSKSDYDQVLDTWGFDMKSTNQTFFSSLGYVKHTPETDLQLAKIIYYYIFERSLFVEDTIVSFERDNKDIEELSEAMVKIDVLDNITPILKKHIESVKTLKYSPREYLDIAERYDVSLDINNIKSRDLKTAFRKAYNINYTSIEEIVNSFGEGKSRANKMFSISMLVSQVDSLSCSEEAIDTAERVVESILAMSDESIEKESATFRKELMQLKKLDDRLVTKINRCLRRGKVTHEQKKKTFLEIATNDEISIKDFSNNIKTLTNLQLFRLYNGLLSAEEGNKYFLVKTGRIGVNEDREANSSPLLKMKRAALILELRERFKKDNIKVIMPEKIELALPTSYKNFVGNIPFFSKVKMPDSGSIGIIWNSQCDYDLSAILSGGEGIAYWGNTKYNGIYYSGDVRSAGPSGAAEYITYEEGTDDFNIFVNLYSHYNNEVHTVKAFMTDNKEFSVKDKPDLVIPFEDFQGQLGTKIGNELVFGGVVSDRNSVGETRKSDIIINFMKQQSQQRLTLNDLVRIVGWEIIEKDDVDTLEDEIVYDFSMESLSKNTFIEIFGE